MKTIILSALLLSGALFHTSLAFAETVEEFQARTGAVGSYKSIYEDEDDNASSSPCYGYYCDKDKDKDDRPREDPMQNKSAIGNSDPKGSIGGIVRGQLQPR